MTSPRYTLFIKKAGTCPFSQRSYIVMALRVPPAEYQVTEIDIDDKPADFLRLNPGGKVPVLIDHREGDKVVTDSAEIVQYINDTWKDPIGCPDLRCGYQGDAVSCGSGVFPAFAKLMKNKDPNIDQSLRDKLVSELTNLNDYLKSHKTKYLLGDELTEPDCALLPRLNQVRAAGSLKNFTIPAELTFVYQYLESVRGQEVWVKTCPTDGDICAGWAKHM